MLIRNDREYFYKYYTADTAKLVLENCSRKWSSPQEFNDPFDTQFDLFVLEDPEAAARKFLEVFMQKLSSSDPIPGSSCSSAAAKMEQLRGLIRKHNISFTAEMNEKQLSAATESVQRFISSKDSVNEVIREWFRYTSIFCVSETNENLLMWAHYAQNHTGAVIKFLSVREVDSPLLIAQRVIYSRNMPRIGPEDFASFSVSPEAIRERLTLTKSIEWAYEKEWRVVAVAEDKNKASEISPFAPEELGAVYLGCKMAETDREELLEIASRKYPKAEIYQAQKHKQEFSLVFERIY